jgi:hypothetical protein
LAITLLCGANAQAQGNSDVGAAVEACAFFFNNGNLEENFDWCLTVNGNITKLESPLGQEHIAVGGFIEGYAICSVFGQSGRDYAQASQIAGFGPTINLGCSGTGCKFQRDTTDGRFRLVMDIKGDKKLHAINISMTVTNITGASIDAVQVIRYADADMNGDFLDDRGDRSVNRSVWGRDVNGLTLTGTTIDNDIPAFARLEDDVGPGVIGPVTCQPPDAYALPAGPVDIGLLVGYNLGQLKSGKSKTVKFQYQRQ